MGEGTALIMALSPNLRNLSGRWSGGRKVWGWEGAKGGGDEKWRDGRGRGLGRGSRSTS